MSDQKKTEQPDKFTWKEGDLILEEEGDGPTLQDLVDQQDDRENRRGS